VGKEFLETVLDIRTDIQLDRGSDVYHWDRLVLYLDFGRRVANSPVATDILQGGPRGLS
jgi:hypothetical protein